MFIIAEDVDGEALAGLIVNKARGTLQVAAVKAPGFGDKRTAALEDIAIVTGATVISTKKGMKLEKVVGDEFGSARLVTANNNITTIVDGKGSAEAIEARAEEIKTLIENSESAYETESLQERLGKLTGGVAVLKIGAESEIELKEKKDRVEDALAATRAAVDEGVIPGGGCGLMRCLDIGDQSMLENEDQYRGWDIIVKSIQSPFRTILENCGLNPDVVWNKIDNTSDTTGFDARKEEVVDMFNAGIIDPTRVTRTALEKAASVAGTMLITECIVTKIPEDKKEELPAGGFGMMQ